MRRLHDNTVNLPPTLQFTFTTENLNLIVPSFVQQHLDITSARCRLFRLRLSGVGCGFSVTGSNLFTCPFYLYPDICIFVIVRNF